MEKRVGNGGIGMVYWYSVVVPIKMDRGGSTNRVEDEEQDEVKVCDLIEWCLCSATSTCREHGGRDEEIEEAE